MSSFTKEIQKKAVKVRNEILNDPVLCSDLSSKHPVIPEPFCKTENPEEIKLIIIGQDPTVRAVTTREKIKTVLMLDDNKMLRGFIDKILTNLSLNINQLYATNLYKCFFNKPPADNEAVLTRHFRYWIDLLRYEISHFPDDVIVITLGEPVMKQLISGGSKKVRNYWGYTGKTHSDLQFAKSPAADNYLQRDIYILPHLPSYQKNKFYNVYFDDYCKYLGKDRFEELIKSF